MLALRIACPEQELNLCFGEGIGCALAELRICFPEIAGAAAENSGIYSKDLSMLSLTGGRKFDGMTKQPTITEQKKEESCHSG